MLFTVLGEFLRDPEQAVWTGTLLTAMGELGFSQAAVRRAISRAASDGWLTSTRTGRTIRWALSARAMRHFEAAAVEVYQRPRTHESWDGDWLILTTSVPESQREARHRLRVRLRWAGLGTLGNGVWVTPRTTSADQVHTLLAELGLLSMATMFIGRIGSVGSEYEVVHEAWDLSALERDYRRFVVNSGHLQAGDTANDVFVRLTRMVHEWRSFALRDPLLPPALLPAKWVGFTAWALFYEKHDAWRPRALSWLQRIDDGGGG